MSSILSFMQPVLASFVFCTLASWGVAQFKAELAQASIPSVVAVAEKAVDATSPAVLAASLPAELQSAAADESSVAPAADAGSDESLFVAPAQTSLDDAATVWTKDAQPNTFERSQHSRSNRRETSATTSAQLLFDPPSLSGPNSLSVVTAPVTATHETTILHDASEYQSVVTMGLQTLVMDSRTVLSENQGEAAVGAIVGAVAAADGEEVATRLDAVPEPSGLALAALGLTGWLLTRRRGSKVANN